MCMRRHKVVCLCSRLAPCFLLVELLYPPSPRPPQATDVTWAYEPPTGKSTFVGSNCWCCERAWYQVSLTTEDRDREKYNNNKGKDGDVHPFFLQQRRGVIDKYTRQRNNDVVRKNCDLRVAVRTSKYQDTFLARPDDDIWPMARYKAKFGSPLLPKNKKLGHVTAICDGIKGVIAPGDDGVGRYKIKNRSGIRVEKDEEEDIGSGSDDHELADAKFAELREEHTKMYQQLAVGAMSSVLNDFALDSDETEQEEGKLKAAAKKHKYE